MIPSRRLLLLLLLPAPLAVAGEAATALGLAAGAVVLVAAFADWVLAGADLKRVAAGRLVDAKLSLGVPNRVDIQLVSSVPRPLTCWVRDVPPSDVLPGPESDPRQTMANVMEPGAVQHQVDVPARGSARVTYHLVPARRGDFRFGDLYLRLLGPLRLVARQRRLAGTEQPIRVYPNLLGLRKYDLLVRRGLLAEAGARPIRSPGASAEFERLREYVPDDEYRRINWKATARRGKLVVNQFEAERSQNLVIMLDAGRLMAARVNLPGAAEPGAVVEGEFTPGLSKLDHAVNTALLLAHVGSLRGDRVALLAYDEEVGAFSPPGRGRRSFLGIVEALYRLQTRPVEPDHGRAFQFLAARNLRRSLVVLFTDLVDRESSSALVAHLLRASRHHLLICVTLADPTISGPARAIPSGSAAMYEKMVAQRILDERTGVLASLRQRGVWSVDTEADRLSPRVISTYLDLKQRGRI